MSVADIPLCIDHTAQGHASQPEDLHFLAIFSCHQVVRVRQADEGNLFVLPVLAEGRSGIRAHRQDLDAALGKLLIVVSQARQLRATVRSHKTAQEGEQHRSAAELRQVTTISLHVIKFKVRGRFPRRDEACH